MTRIFYLAVAALLILPCAAHALDIGGAWDSNQGPATFTAASGGYAVAFQKQSGKVTGTLSDEQYPVFIGAWVRPASEQRCTTEKDGSAYWGNFRVTFYKPDIFTGVWSYCGKLDEGTLWTGARPKR